MSPTRPGEHGQHTLAVFDFGKTNTKMFVFDADLRAVHQERCAPLWRDALLGDAPCRVLEHEPLWRWMNAALSRALAQHAIGGVMVTTHGCTAALLGQGALQFPILDYESAPPAAIDAAYDAIAPSFAESATPHLPGGLNLARQFFWIESVRPEAMARTDSILTYPQYWCWRLAGRAVSEISSLGCHTHLWSPRDHDFSSLVDARGWRGRFPPFERAGTVLGHFDVVPEGGTAAVSLPVHNGLHDSNASLHCYRSLGHADATVVSTGTWVIVFNPRCPLEALDAERDMLANMTVDRQPVATARFMGGREYDLITEGTHVAVDAGAIESALAKGQFALPSFAPGGPYPAARGHLEGPLPASAIERAAIAALYLACMTDAVLDLIRSEAEVIVDGGLAYNAAFVGLLAALRPAQRVLVNPAAEGSAAGAAVIAWQALGHAPVLQPCQPVAAWSVPGLVAYRDQWRARAAHASPVTTFAE